MRDESKLPTVLRKKLPPKLEKIRQGCYTKNDLDYPIHLYLKENDIRVTEEGSDIAQFLRGKNILITGATGFLGKLLLEKLFRTCKDIGNIFIITRSKNGKEPQQRINEFLENWVFYKLSEIHPNFKDKVIGISGDFELDEIGLTEQSKAIIREKVNIIYHVAASIRFDEKLQKAVKVNLRGTQHMIKLAKECRQLDAFVHVSTAFSNCHEKIIKEEFYPPHMDPYHLMTFTENLPDDLVEKNTSYLLGSVPNTYAFTKQITEDIVRKEANNIPVCIYRPSIVIASVKEPVRSWVDNIFGPVGLIEAAATGLLHVMLGEPNGRCDMVPADYVINSCIAATYKTAKDRMLDKIQIFNFTTADENPLYWKNLGLAADQGAKVGSTVVLYKGFHRFTACHYWYFVLNFLLHTVPGYFVDLVAEGFGKKPRLRSAYGKINKFVNVLAHFTLNQWKFENSNVRNLWQELNEIDKKNFPFDMKTLNWKDYFDTYLVAMREFLLFEFLDNLEEGRQQKTRMDIIHYVTLSVITLLSVYFLLNTIFFFVPLTILGIFAYYAFTEPY